MSSNLKNNQNELNQILGEIKKKALEIKSHIEQITKQGQSLQELYETFNSMTEEEYFTSVGDLEDSVFDVTNAVGETPENCDKVSESCDTLVKEMQEEVENPVDA